MRCPLLYNDRCLGYDSAENCVFLQLQFSDCTDHVILVVGCGKDASQGQYWVVRYLGRSLYELGYVRVAFGALSAESQCSWTFVLNC